jgi:hypothetical protein
MTRFLRNWEVETDIVLPDQILVLGGNRSNSFWEPGLEALAALEAPFQKRLTFGTS